jgi:hypothetical protein
MTACCPPPENEGWRILVRFVIHSLGQIFFEFLLFDLVLVLVIDLVFILVIAIVLVKS